MEKKVFEKEKNVPVLASFDVVVVGGGVAGVSAAVAARRNGADVCLIENGTIPGGLATAGLVAYFLPLCDGSGRQVISGIPEELMNLSIKYGPGEIPECWMKDGSIEKKREERFMVKFNPHSFAISIEEFMRENGVRLFYDTRFCDCLIENGALKAVFVENKGGRWAVLGRSFIDATGDADVCHRAGEKTIELDSNRKAGWFYLFDKGKISLEMLGVNPYTPLSSSGRTFSGTDPEHVTDFCVESRKVILDYLKSNGGTFRETYPVVIPAFPQFRMTRRLEGAYELDEKESGKYFSDSVCMCGDWRNPGPFFYIPFRCLKGKTKNLLATGRCLSVTEAMWDITRAIPVCSATGQAAGTAAALSADVHSVDISLLQKKLTEQGVIIKPELASRGMACLKN